MPTFTRSTRAIRAGRRGGVVVEGVDKVVRDFTRGAVVVRAGAEAVVVHHAERAAQRMRNTVPIDQGDVLDSITADQKATREGGAVFADAGPDPQANPAAFVARFLEHGTVNMAPRPFVGPAADETVPEFVRAIQGLSRLS